MTAALAAGAEVDEKAAGLRSAGSERGDYFSVRESVLSDLSILLRGDRPAESTLADVRVIVAAVEVVDNEMFEQFEQPEYEMREEER